MSLSVWESPDYPIPRTSGRGIVDDDALPNHRISIPHGIHAKWDRNRGLPNIYHKYIVHVNQPVIRMRSFITWEQTEHVSSLLSMIRLPNV